MPATNLLASSACGSSGCWREKASNRAVKHRGPARALGGIVDAGGDLGMLLAGQPPFRHVERAGDDGEHIVEIVGDAAGQLADRFHLLHLADLGLGLAPLGGLGLERAGPLGDSRLQRGVEVAQRPLALPPDLIGAQHAVDQHDDGGGDREIDAHRHPALRPEEPERLRRGEQVIIGEKARNQSGDHARPDPAEKGAQRDRDHEQEERRVDEQPAKLEPRP